MYEAPQCKVLIAGQSYMKCMELKRMLNWAEEGFRLVLEQNICSCETPIERVDPDILILVGITGWMDVKVILDSFAKRHSLAQIILVCDEKNPLGLAGQLTLLPMDLTAEMLRQALQAARDECAPAAAAERQAASRRDAARDLLLQHSSRVTGWRVVIARLCFELPCQSPAVSLRLEDAFRATLGVDVIFYQESFGRPRWFTPAGSSCFPRLLHNKGRPEAVPWVFIC